ncbi:MAG: DNA cytosine methyltransferase [Proteobacteria bacterium]|nr:DNA cytosine methyltransferase [Pseudomonadota bacterium]
MPIKVFDFFSGCGGTSKGFQHAGMDIVFALEKDSDSVATFRKNFPGVQILQTDILRTNPVDISEYVESCGDEPLLFCGCAPCQPFTKQNTTKRDDDERVYLLNEFRFFIEAYEPEYIFVENVPGMQKVNNTKSPFAKFATYLVNNAYHVDYDIIYSKDFGVPQRRRRLVLIASLLGDIKIPQKTHGPGTNNEHSFVRDWIGDLPPIEAGTEHSEIPNHRAARLAPINLERIRATPEGGGRPDWPKHLWLECHKGEYPGHTDVYGRMRWGEPATGLTTRCISYSNGRFGHPVQNRAISVREAACLQTFPMDFIFEGSLSSMARQIGNAVPVRLAEVFGNHINEHYTRHIANHNNG